MNRTKKFFLNTVTTALYQVAVMVCGFILPRVMLSQFGSGINGLVSSITQFVSSLTVVEAGLSGAIVYSLYKPLAEEDTLSVNRIVTAARNFYYRTGYLFLGLILGGALVYPLFVQTELLSGWEISVLFVVLGANGILEFFTLAKYRALLTADQKTYIISLASIVQVVLNCVIITVLSYLGLSIVIVRCVAILSILLRTVILWLYCKRSYRFLDFSVEPDNSALKKRWDALYFQIVGIVHTSSPIIIATFFLTLNDVSVYSIYYVVISGIQSVMGIFTSGLSAGFGDLLARGEKENFKRAFRQFEYMYYLLNTLIYAVMMATYIPFIRVYTAGADINYVFPLFAILITVNGYFYNLKTPYGMLTIAAGKYRESRVQVTVQAVLQVGLGILFSLFWGLNGLIVGSLISNLYRDIDFIFFAPKHLVEGSFRESMVMWIRSLVLFFACGLIGFWIPSDMVSGYFSWILYAVLVFIPTLLVVLAVNYLADRKQMKACLQRVTGILKRR